MPLTLSVLPGVFAVAQLSPDAPPPVWAMQGDVWHVTRTDDELSVVTAEAHVPDGVRHEGGWAALKLHGPFAFHLTGVLASILNPLAAADIGIFALSTFNTDYVLVKAERLNDALGALRAAGHTLRAPH
ncbi:ACT domain-containing protein [Deinococcus maricopensis]|uniref:Uncharacterized protein n=1 Tax=Deinococcus maricopensis (strain DSM 21211 / LMG 22137 / NRRL B-23946 / LB-34) TaxID=709986 RepID=E8U967_DEIML|nr:ACT domain-containing protein [Deinococcus maricopensis]ADV67606.1 hypothetical protein Deima_1961 [Deinococcus maricopensis DSM 21211]